MSSLLSFLLSTVQFIGVLILVLLVFNLMIVVHEWGHFLAARWRGLQIDRFQIWFGKPIWKKTINGVQYGLGTIPAGGFVMLPQMASMEAIEGEVSTKEPLPEISPMDKIIVAFAGPLFSFLLAVVFAVVVWIVKYPESRASNSTTIGVVLADSPGERAGLKPGDVVKAVGGTQVTSFSRMTDSVTWEVISSEEDALAFDIVRDGQPMTIDVNVPIPKIPDSVPWYQRIFKRPPLRQVGIGPAMSPVIIGNVMENSPAQMAGIREEDRILELNGEKLYNFMALIQYTQSENPDSIDFKILQDGDEKNVTVHPRVPESPGDYDPTIRRIGMGEMGQRDTRRLTEYRDNQLKRDDPVTLIVRPLRVMYNTITAVASPTSGVSAAHLSGAPMIVYIYYKLFKNPDGWRLVLWFSVLLNVNLAIMNLLPFPVLDGGHIMTALWEMVTRRPIPVSVMKALYSSCAILLIGFMVFIAGFDFRDIFNDVSQTEKEPFRFLEAGASAAPL